jgi:hypothetical protein
MRTSQSFQDLEGPTTLRRANLYSHQIFFYRHIRRRYRKRVEILVPKSSNPLPSPPPHITVYRRGFSVALCICYNIKTFQDPKSAADLLPRHHPRHCRPIRPLGAAHPPAASAASLRISGTASRRSLFLLWLKIYCSRTFIMAITLHFSLVSVDGTICQHSIVR